MVSIDGNWADPAMTMTTSPAICDGWPRRRGKYDPDNFFRLNNNIAPA